MAPLRETRLSGRPPIPNHAVENAGSSPHSQSRAELVISFPMRGPLKKPPKSIVWEPNGSSTQARLDVKTWNPSRGPMFGRWGWEVSSESSRLSLVAWLNLGDQGSKYFNRQNGVPRESHRIASHRIGCSADEHINSPLSSTGQTTRVALADVVF